MEVVLITGCSSGIGRELARALSANGYRVVATARNGADLADLDVALKLPLDVTDEVSVWSAVKAVMDQFGCVDVLINNAGMGLRGAIEDVPIGQIQKMFDVNVHGAIRMVQAVVPVMRDMGGGRIVNIGSIAGKITTPMSGGYAASKFAVEALSDALRWELYPFHIDVILIEPGNIETNFHETSLKDSVLENENSPYAPLYQKFAGLMGRMRKNQPGPEAVAAVVLKALSANKPKARYMAAVPFKSRLALALPDGVLDKVMRSLYHLRRRNK